MDKSLLSRRPLSETYSVRNVLDSYGDTPVCEAVYPTRGHTGPDSLFAALKLSFKQQLENHRMLSLTSERLLIAVAFGSFYKSAPKPFSK